MIRYSYMIIFQNAVEVLWTCVSDLLIPKTQREDRKLVLKFLYCLIKGQVLLSIIKKSLPLFSVYINNEE